MKLYQEGIGCSLDVKDVASCYHRRLTNFDEEPVFRSGSQRGYWTIDFGRSCMRTEDTPANV